jgi:hypothetical protein
MNNILQSNNNITNLDAAETIFFMNELNRMKTTLYERPMPILKANELIPVSRSTDKGAETVTYTMYDRANNGKVISNYADDLPTVEVMGKVATNPIRSFGDSFIISVQDLNAARFASKDVFAMKAFAALESHLVWMNNTAFFGIPDCNLTGWLTNPYIATAAVAGDTDPHKLWSYKAITNPDLILADLKEIANATMLASSGLYKADSIVMPFAQYSLIEGLRVTGTETTVLEYFTRTTPGVTVYWANELAGGFSTKDGMIAFRKREEDFWQEIPLSFEMYAPQWNNLAYKVPCHSRHGGTVVARPETQTIRTGI